MVPGCFLLSRDSREARRGRSGRGLHGETLCVVSSSCFLGCIVGSDEEEEEEGEAPSSAQRKDGSEDEDEGSSSSSSSSSDEDEDDEDVTGEERRKKSSRLSSLSAGSAAASASSAAQPDASSTAMAGSSTAGSSALTSGGGGGGGLDSSKPGQQGGSSTGEGGEDIQFLGVRKGKGTGRSSVRGGEEEGEEDQEQHAAQQQVGTLGRATTVIVLLSALRVQRHSVVFASRSLFVSLLSQPRSFRALVFWVVVNAALGHMGPPYDRDIFSAIVPFFCEGADGAVIGTLSIDHVYDLPPVSRLEGRKPRWLWRC